MHDAITVMLFCQFQLHFNLKPYTLERNVSAVIINPQLSVTVVFIHPRANEVNAAETLGSVVHWLQSISPDAPGDFNKCSMRQCLRNFYQYVSCPTRHNKTLDHCYGSIKGAYKSVVQPPVGSVGHNTVLLVPVYKTVLKRVHGERRVVWGVYSIFAGMPGVYRLGYLLWLLLEYRWTYRCH